MVIEPCHQPGQTVGIQQGSTHALEQRVALAQIQPNQMGRRRDDRRHAGKSQVDQFTRRPRDMHALCQGVQQMHFAVDGVQFRRERVKVLL